MYKSSLVQEKYEQTQRTHDCNHNQNLISGKNMAIGNGNGNKNSYLAGECEDSQPEGNNAGYGNHQALEQQAKILRCHVSPVSVTFHNQIIGYYNILHHFL
jgi:hypothetical protein